MRHSAGNRRTANQAPARGAKTGGDRERCGATLELARWRFNTAGGCEAVVLRRPVALARENACAPDGQASPAVAADDMLVRMTGSREHRDIASSGPAVAAGIPEEFFIFVDQSHPIAQHNYRFTRTFTSRFADRLYTAEGRRVLDGGQIDPMPFAPNPNADPSLSPFAVTAMNDYRIEWDAELCRKAIVPQAPSRCRRCSRSTTSSRAWLSAKRMGGGWNRCAGSSWSTQGTHELRG